MTTPPGPDEPRYATGYGGARYPMPEGAPTPPQYSQPPQYSGYPYGAEQYSPYGPPPAGYGQHSGPPPSRPGLMVLGLILLILATLPFLVFGLVFLLVPLGPELIPTYIFDTPGLPEAGITTFDALAAIIRTIGGFFTALAVVYLVFVVIGFLGQNWARILTAVMTGGFAVLLLLGVVSALGTDPTSAVVLAVPVALSVAGIVTWFAPQANRWYAERRAG